MPGPISAGHHQASEDLPRVMHRPRGAPVVGVLDRPEGACGLHLRAIRLDPAQPSIRARGPDGQQEQVHVAVADFGSQGGQGGGRRSAQVLRDWPPGSWSFHNADGRGIAAIFSGCDRDDSPATGETASRGMRDP
jgi:hypothetical protein